MLYQDKNFSEYNENLAAEAFSRACTLGNGFACSSLGLYYHNQKNYEKARSLFDISCKRECAEGCNNLATLIKDEAKSENDLKVAFNLYEKACNLHDNLACVNLGIMHVYGDGTKKDVKQGLFHISNACSNNNALACNLEAFFYKDGLSVKKDKNKALELFKKSCNLEFTQGCKNYDNLKNQK